MFVLQLEKSKKTKKPLTNGEVMLLMIMCSVLQQRMQKFLVLNQVTDNQQDSNHTVRLLIQMNSFDNHKTLGRALQSLLKEMFDVRDCVVMFKDLRRDQFFNIVYADDDDRKNTFNASLQKRKDVIKALKDEGAAKNKDRIQSE